LLLSLLLSTAANLTYNKFSTLEYEISSLKSENKALETQKRSLETINKHNKERINEYRNSLIAKKLKRAKLQLAQASIGTIIPLAGSTAIIALTANDIHNFCQDIQELKELETFMFGTFDHAASEDEKLLCTYDIQKELLHALDKYPKDSEKWMKDQYKKIEDKAKKKMDKWF